MKTDVLALPSILFSIKRITFDPSGIRTKEDVEIYKWKENVLSFRSPLARHQGPLSV